MTQTLVEGITLRPYDAERDAARVKEIVAEIWGGGDDALMERLYGIQGGKPWGEWTSGAVLRALGNPETRGFVAEENGAIVAFASYGMDEVRKTGTVGYNGVARSHQGRGLGTAMLDFVMERFREAGMEYARVLVFDNEEHLPARRNYEKHGFKRLVQMELMVQKL
jgi:ribosomal protein S18 acetylase RimI-like enzyme